MKLGGYLLFCLLLSPMTVTADEYDFDIKGMHAFIDFRIQHLGFSWMSGRFNRFSGRFSYDESNPAASDVSVTIETGSVDTNHAERDKHLRGEAYLDAKEFPKATFISTSFTENADGTAILIGDFTLRGISKPLEIAVTPVGHGYDPWTGYRRGFVGEAQFKLTDYGISISMLGEKSNDVYLTLSVEGIRD
ncbi:MAG: YceI family protein [Piscirickettsiaceae bacterium]|nr:YceI family protein [Piscirickettsiaceae bacterium]